MNFIIYFSYIFISTVVLVSWGNFFLKKININNLDYMYIAPILGFFIIGSITLIIHFFFPINYIIGNIILFFGILFFLLNKEFKNQIKLISIISVISFITILFDNINRPDAALYHLPYIAYLNESKIILGINNLESRYGHISFLQYTSSAFKNVIFKDKALFIPVVTIYSCSIVFFLKNFYLQNDNKIKIISLFFLLTILIDMNRFSEFGNDEIAHIVFFIFIFYILKFLIQNKTISATSFNIILLFSLMLFMIKGTYIPIFFLIVYITLNQNLNLNLKTILFNKLFFILFFIFFMWILKNFLTSGCLIFPLQITCFEKLLWSNNLATETSLINEAWAKGYPETNRNLEYREYIQNFNWLKIWLNSNLIFILKKIGLVILPIFLIIFFSHNETRRDIKLYYNIKITLFFLFGFIVFWFLNFPVYRFGSGFIYAFIVIAVAIYFNNFNEKKIKKISSIILVLCFSIVFLKNIKRINDNFSIQYYDYPWLQIYSDKQNKKIEYEKIFYSNNKKFFYFFPIDNLCFYSPGPCSYIKKKKLNIHEKLGYLVISQ